MICYSTEKENLSSHQILALSIFFPPLRSSLDRQLREKIPCWILQEGVDPDAQPFKRVSHPCEILSIISLLLSCFLKSSLQKQGFEIENALQKNVPRFLLTIGLLKILFPKTKAKIVQNFFSKSKKINNFYCALI